MTMDGTNYPVNSLQHYLETIYQSGLYYNFIGIAQLIASFLLMTQLFSTLGAIIFYPIILNIFLITVSYGFVGTPVITGLMLLANTYLLLWDYEKLKPLITKPSAQIVFKSISTNTIENDNIWILTGLLIFTTTLLFRFISYNIVLWFFTCVAEGLVVFIYYKLTLKAK